MPLEISELFHHKRNKRQGNIFPILLYHHRPIALSLEQPLYRKLACKWPKNMLKLPLANETSPGKVYILHTKNFVF